MIPKIIHYCWFGDNPLPELAKKCVASWKKYSPDYEIILWNEDNFDIKTVFFTEQVAKEKKWGFIVDYIRAHVIYHYGGIYLDTDVELLKPFSDDILQNICFSGFQDEKNIAPGLVFAGEKGCHIAKELMDFYASYNSMNKDGELSLVASPEIFTNMLLKYGLKQNNEYQELGVFTSYPTEYFCPMSYKTGLISVTQNTYCIHYYAASWLPEEYILNNELRWRVYAILGDNVFSKIIIAFCLVTKKIKTHGILATLEYCRQKYIHEKNLRLKDGDNVII